MKKHIYINLLIIIICIISLVRIGFNIFPLIIIILQIFNILLLYLHSSWSHVDSKIKKPLKWWYHKFLCEFWYKKEGSSRNYYKHLNIMCKKYKINLYGKKL